MSQYIKAELDGHILRITFNRPDKMNAMSGEMYDYLTEQLKQADANPEVRVIYFCGAGDNFSAGNEISLFVDAIDDESGAKTAEILEPANRVLQQLAKTEKPMVAAVQGVAVGIGANLMLHCDLAYADSKARFMLPFINLGIAPEGGCSHLLPRMIGHVKAAELLLLGEFFSSQKAAELGIINSVFEPEELQDRAWGMAKRLAAKPPAALRQMKAMMKQSPNQPLDKVIRAEVDAIGERFRHGEAREALSAFTEKRAPDFSRFS